MTIYLVVHDPDPGYAAPHILGAFSNKEAAAKRVSEQGIAYDIGIIELPLDEAVDKWLDGSTA